MKKYFLGTILYFLPIALAFSQRIMENLDRGLVAVRTSPKEVFLSWRFLGTEPSGIGFNVYRGNTRLNPTPLTQATNYTDQASSNEAYSVRAVQNGVEQPASSPVNVWTKPYKSIPLRKPADGINAGGTYSYSPNDCSVGDLDGDGEYEIIVKWNPSNAKDNSHNGYTGNVFLDAYKLNGTFLWRIDLGKNIRAGAHYTQFMVYDLDNDGKAEVACRTSDGTIDGTGKVMGDASADYRNPQGHIISGPEYLTVFNGQTGAAITSTTYLPQRHPTAGDNPTAEQMQAVWGDSKGNRIDRFLACIAYLDGQHPSLVMCRGYYTRAVLVAWDFKDGKLTQRWIFDSEDGTPGHKAYSGQGNHNLSVGDVDGDGRDEIMYGSCAIDDNGTGLFSTGLGHGDALHMTDMNPDRPGQEVYQPHESPGKYGNNAFELRDARTGQLIFGGPGPNHGDIGRGMAADIDPRHKGYEVWSLIGGVYNMAGQEISTARPSINFGIWWDGDLSRELLDGTTITKWDYLRSTTDTLLAGSTYAAASNNGTKANPCLSADLLGDWREELLVRHSNNEELLLFTTTIPTQPNVPRLRTLMHDPQYRLAVAWQNVAYNQPPHPSFFLGTDMRIPAQPPLKVVPQQKAKRPLRPNKPPRRQKVKILKPAKTS